MARWYELGAYYPFFRNHAHLDAKRRELWEFEHDYAHRMRNAIVQRYQLFPYVYTLFRMSSLTGEPIMRPVWFDFDEDTSTAVLFNDESFMFGPALLVQGIYEEGVSEVTMVVPGNRSHVWYVWKERESKDQHLISGGEQIRLSGYQQGIPVLQLGGTIIPMTQRIRRSTALMKRDPITLVIALSKNGSSKGMMYMDDGVTFQYQSGVFTNVEMEFANCSLYNKVIHNMYVIPSNGHLIEKIIILGPLEVIERIEIVSKAEQHTVTKDLFQQNQHCLTVKTMPLRLSLNHNFQVKLITKNDVKCLK